MKINQAKQKFEVSTKKYFWWGLYLQTNHHKIHKWKKIPDSPTKIYNYKSANNSYNI